MSINAFEILKIDELNSNNRIYTRKLVEKIVEDQKEIYFGMIGMPTDHNATVDFLKVSHACDNLRIEDDKLIADVKILDTPEGKVLKQLVESVPSGAFRIAGYGTFVQGSLSGEVHEYTLTSINWVGNPS
jgi:hypothetical protein